MVADRQISAIIGKVGQQSFTKPVKQDCDEVNDFEHSTAYYKTRLTRVIRLLVGR